jgi:flagellar basal body-associated protein FliL
MKKILPIVLVALLAGGAGAKFFLLKPAKAEPKPKVHGTPYILGKEFLINLQDGRYAKLDVALVLSHDDTSTVAAGGHEAATPPEGYGAMGQESIVRGIITDDITDKSADDLTDPTKREHLLEELLKDIKAHTDVKVEHVLFTDLTVQ